MKILKILSTSSKSMQTSSTCDFLKQRHDAYIKLQQQRPKAMRNPVPQKVSFLEDVLTLIGALPIKRPNLK